MDPVVVLDMDRLSVDPGGVAVASVTVRNLSNRVESYDLAVLGPAAAWAEVVPSQLRIYTQDEHLYDTIPRSSLGGGCRLRVGGQVPP